MKITVAERKKRERFCKSYAFHHKPTQAARDAGYPEKSASWSACKLLTESQILERISEIEAELLKKYDLTAERVLQEYAKIALSSLHDYVEGRKNVVMVKNIKDINPEDWPAVAKLKNTKYGVEIALHDKKGALDSLARIMGMFKDSSTLNLKSEGGPVSKIEIVVVDPGETKDITPGRYLEESDGDTGN